VEVCRVLLRVNAVDTEGYGDDNENLLHVMDAF
jgi:hypothetical protein